MGNLYVRVSEISQYLICPRQVYFTSKGYESDIEIDNFLEHLLFREISRMILEMSSEDIKVIENLTKKIDQIMDNILIIYKKDLKNIHLEKINEIKSHFISNLNLDLLEKLKSNKMAPYEEDCELNHEKIGLVGCLDSLVKTGEEYQPYLIKTGNSPDFGVWKSDRLCLTAYAILIEESFGTNVNEGFIEYTRIAEVRETELKSYDRRKVLSLINRIKKIKEGALPDRVDGKVCANCSFEEACKVKKSLLSKFF